ncbi:hypothetical protein FVEG_15113 [Fusarium verticillioides 7600]|uniref:Uncharacterized protein n=1 Tax=Gibberella moniliformis (strain M3125 / FGSC 7600) TaxID=334819 RepID=W7LL89_GIBM7|nr:hypothetical protein FVEG_15113 [Fusarium verticillioides 7600]EWG40163.1 hypothetical protein FVEG_15113 [Fusarium verticillioides 7600]
MKLLSTHQGLWSFLETKTIILIVGLSDSWLHFTSSWWYMYMPFTASESLASRFAQCIILHWLYFLSSSYVLRLFRIHPSFVSTVVRNQGTRPPQGMHRKLWTSNALVGVYCHHLHIPVDYTIRMISASLCAK